MASRLAHPKHITRRSRDSWQMPGDSDSSLDEHSPVALNVLDAVETFADAFSDRAIPGHLNAVVRDGKYLRAKHVGQKPERFVEEQLIWPLLDRLTYEYRPQPHGYPKFTRNFPDFAVLNFECGIDCAVIGEVKTLNKFEYAEDNIREYLGRDLEEPTVGIATDGVRWKLIARPERDQAMTEVADVDLSNAFEKMVIRHVEEDSYDSHSVRQAISDVEQLYRPNVELEAQRFFED